MKKKTPKKRASRTAGTPARSSSPAGTKRPSRRTRELPDSIRTVVVAEKPAVARDIAHVVGAHSRAEGYLYGEGIAVTWAVGHLVELPQPSDLSPQWKSWTLAALPMLPSRWPLQVIHRLRPQFRQVAALLNHGPVQRIVCATDAGREGELIFRFILEAAGCTKPVERLWISSLTPHAIREGFERLRPASEYDALADSARGRALADWLVGMNLSRAYTLRRGVRGEVYSVGRVQTPTLAMLVEREQAIAKFTPQPYREVHAQFEPERSEPCGAYEGVYFDPEIERTLRAQQAEDALERARRLPAGTDQAQRIAERARTGRARVEAIEAVQKRMPAPQLYDLTELQRHANRLWGWSAKKTLDVAQALYERAKLITYPRTDSRHLSASVAETLADVVNAVAPRYEGLIAPGSGERALSARFVCDSKVRDHHAILPTTTAAAELSADESALYDLVCRRLLSAWHADHVYSVTTVVSAIEHADGADHYRTTGTSVDEIGWRVLELPPSSARNDGERSEAVALPPGLGRGEPLRVHSAQNLLKRTRPPRRMTEAALLSAMETAGKTLEDRELAEAMREGGLGTPATRASIIEGLISRGYVGREEKALRATEKGIELISAVHSDVKSAAMTGLWERELGQIERGERDLDSFLESIQGYVSKVVNLARESAPAQPERSAACSAPPRASQGRGGPSALAPHWVKGRGGSAWMVRAEPGLEGRAVQVHRANGSTSSVQLGTVAERQGRLCLYHIESKALRGSGSAPRA